MTGILSLCILVTGPSNGTVFSSEKTAPEVYAMVGDLDTSAFFSPGGADAMAIDPASGLIVWINEGLSFVSNPLPVLGSLFYGYYWDISDTADGLTRLDAATA